MVIINLLTFLSVPSYPKSSMKRDYVRREELPPPRSRVAMDYGSRIIPERRTSYRDDYPSRGPGYDMHRNVSHPVPRRDYPDDGYGQRFDRPPTYRDGRARDYDSIPGSKRPYSALVSVCNSGVLSPSLTSTFLSLILIFKCVM